MLYSYQAQIDEKRLNLKLKNEELNSYIKSNMHLENFAHLASHELKTPLKNVANFSSLLKKKLIYKLDDKEVEILDILTSEVGVMNGLIEDLLQLSVIDNVDLKFSRFSVSEFLNQIIEKNFIENKSIINIDVRFGYINSHKQLLSQLFINLIDNAIKFTNHSHDIEIQIVGFEEPEFYQFSIIDNGIGISQEYKEHVFLIFKRLHNNLDYNGTGIGLSICKRIVERLEGSIWVKENPSGGSIFEFRISKRHNSSAGSPSKS